MACKITDYLLLARIIKQDEAVKRSFESSYAAMETL